PPKKGFLAHVARVFLAADDAVRESVDRALPSKHQLIKAVGIAPDRPGDELFIRPRHAERGRPFLSGCTGRYRWLDGRRGLAALTGAVSMRAKVPTSKVYCGQHLSSLDPLIPSWRASINRVQSGPVHSTRRTPSDPCLRTLAPRVSRGPDRLGPPAARAAPTRSRRR